MASLSSVSVTISHPSNASDEQEGSYLARARILHWVRAGLAVTILGVAAGVVGVEGQSLYFYNKTVPYSRVGLPLWPLNLDLRDTNALLSCGVLISFQAIVYTIAALLPSVRGPLSTEFRKKHTYHLTIAPPSHPAA